MSAFVVEQPELHLHPHHQVLLARAFAGAAMEERGPMLIVETHSDHLIGEIGRMVSRDELSPERVQILCVDAHPDGGAKIEQATFDEDGYLNNWPVGFLSP
ncbi:MAG: AAA family ATPase [Deltaproteobacteria bacterium]|nr:AAA family ATPase [Deltaproteobacteria bacterium]